MKRRRVGTMGSLRRAAVPRHPILKRKDEVQPFFDFSEFNWREPSDLVRQEALIEGYNL